MAVDEQAEIAAASPDRPARLAQRASILSLLGNPPGAALDLDVDELWALACAKAGVAVGDPPCGILFDGLRRLAGSIERSGNCDAAGRRIARADIFAWMLSYLAFGEDRARHPEGAEIPMRRPLFIAGFGRTGSTLLHNLLALDENARAPRLWELWKPSPPPRPRGAIEDERVALAQRRLAHLAKVAPLTLQVHPMDARAPDECQWLMRHSTLFVLLYRVPEYWLWLKTLSVAELEPLYAHYKLQIQYLQLFCRGGHWLSKSFAHLHYLPVLRSVFPDARVVRLHRDPCDAVPSLCSLAAAYRSIYMERCDFAELGMTMLDMFTEGMRRTIAADPGRDRHCFADVQYDDLVADPLRVVRRLYDQLDYPYSAAFEARIIEFVKRSRGLRRHRHVYSLEQFGLSRARVLGACEDYLTWLRSSR